MVHIKPFRAIRARDDLAHKVCEPPYDVVSTEQARAIAQANPLSFFHVSKPEVDLPPGTSPFSPEVYLRGALNFKRMLQDGILVPDVGEFFYLYRLQVNTHSQTGLVAVVSCKDYLDGVVKRHELTRPEYEQDRARHIEAIGAQTGPALLFHRPNQHLTAIAEEWTATAPDTDFIAPDGVRHTVWTINHSGTIRRIMAVFERIPALYIADGHHRTAAAVRVCQSRNGTGGAAWFLGVIFPSDQMRILPYNRLIRDLNGLSESQFLARLSGFAEISPATHGEPAHKHQIRLYLRGQWYELDIKPELTRDGDPAQTLDVALLQKHVLEPVLGVDDPRTSPKIWFLGGSNTTAKLQAMVDSGEYACAFSMYPVSAEDIMVLADAGRIMPPKSTWFEPKLRDGLFSHPLE